MASTARRAATTKAAGSRSASFLHLPLGRLCVPRSNLRRTSGPSELRRLRASVEQHGILVPIVVRARGSRRYDVVDGGRRVRALRSLDAPASTSVPAVLLELDAGGSLVAQVQINQVRERLSALAEAEALRTLVEERGRTAAEAGRLLGRSRSWASRVLRVFALPARIVSDLRSDRISLAQARVLVDFAGHRKALRTLHRHALAGASVRALEAMGPQLREGRGPAVVPTRRSLGDHSWARIEPVHNGFRLAARIDQRDRVALAKLGALVAGTASRTAVTTEGRA